MGSAIRDFGVTDGESLSDEGLAVVLWDCWDKAELGYYMWFIRDYLNDQRPCMSQEQRRRVRKELAMIIAEYGDE